jgi:hypothetical protein
MMRQRMMRLRDPDLRVRPAGLLASVHERDHACQIGLVREQLQVVQQLDVRLEAVGHA